MEYISLSCYDVPCRACGSYRYFLDRWLLLQRKLLNQGLLLEKLISSFWNPNSRHHDLFYRYRISVLQMPTGMFRLLYSLIIGFAAIVTWRVSLVGQEVLTFLVYISSSMDISCVLVAQSLVSVWCFASLSLSFCSFLVVSHYIVSSSMHRFWYHQTFIGR